MSTAKLILEKCKEHVSNPIFQKPIKTTDYSERGVIILVTRIKPNHAKQA